MTPRLTLDEIQAARRREVARRRREIEAAAEKAGPRKLRLRLSDEPVDGLPAPRKGDAEALRHSADSRAALTDEECELVDALQDALRRRADLRLRPQPGVEPPPLPGTPELRASLRAKLASVPLPDPDPRAREALDDFADLGPADDETEEAR